VELVERRIYLIRGQKAMLDSDLAELYQVPTFRLNEAVKRNRNGFPEDFMFQLTAEEAYAFTEHGVAMLLSVLNSGRAVQMNIVIIRAFVRMRELLSSHKSSAQKIEKLERTQKQHGSILVAVVQDIQRLKNPQQTRAIGFRIPPSPKKK
jgi:N-acyl-L-homoserine lactone synthetase